MPSRASVTSILDRELSSQAAGNDPLNPAPLSGAMLNKMHAYWRAANYLSVAQIYLQDNPLLDLSLRLEHIKPRLLGRNSTPCSPPTRR